MTHIIGTLKERTLHADLKNWYSHSGDQIEAKVGNYIIDIIRGKTLIEIQTRNFSAIRRKLQKLLDDGYKVHLLHPIAQTNTITYTHPKSGKELSTRKSSHKGKFTDVFAELIRIPHLIPHPNLHLKVLLIHQHETRCKDNKGSWRRKKVSVKDCKLVEVLETITFCGKKDYINIIPATLPQPFTNKDLGAVYKIPNWKANYITYTLKKAGWLEEVGRNKDGILYTENRNSTTSSACIV